jgi:hypothetical protein
MHLPVEIILKIISHLDSKDIINLGISKLFLPTLLTVPFYLEKIHDFALHAICQLFMARHNLCQSCIIIPIVIDKSFLFALDIYKLKYFKSVTKKPILNIEMFSNVLKFLAAICNSFDWYKNLSDQCKIQKTLNWLLECNSECYCDLFVYSKKKN